MKKTVFKVLVTLCVAIAMFLGSCGDGSDDGGGSGGGGIGGGGGGVNSGLNGTWVYTYVDPDTGSVNHPDTGVKMEVMKIVLNNGSITESLSLSSLLSGVVEWSETRRGTYSTSGNNITINFTQVKGSMGVGVESSQWYTEQQYRTAMIQFIVDNFEISQSEAEEMYDESVSGSSMFGSSTGTYTLNGNTLTFTFSSNTMTASYSLGVFTRQ